MHNYLKFFDYTYLWHYLNQLGKVLPFMFLSIFILTFIFFALVYLFCKTGAVDTAKGKLILISVFVLFLLVCFFILSVGNPKRINMELSQEGQRLEKQYINKAHQEYPYVVEINGHKYLSKTEKGHQLIRLHTCSLHTCSKVKAIKYYFVPGNRSLVFDSKNYLEQKISKRLSKIIVYPFY